MCLIKINIMDEEFIPYEQALALKELGFNEACVGFFENDRQGSKIKFTYFHTIKDYNSIESDGLLELFGTKTSEEKKQSLIEQNLLFPWTSAPTYRQAFKYFRVNYNIENVSIKHRLFSTIYESGYYYKYGIGKPNWSDNVIKHTKKLNLNALKN